MSSDHLPRYTRSMDLDHLLPRLRVQLRELAAFRDLARIELGPASFRAADGVRAEVAVGEEWPSRAWPVSFRFAAAVPADLGVRPDGGRSDLAIRFDVGGEGLLAVDGKVVGGLNPYHREYVLDDAHDGSLDIEITAVPKAPFAVEIPHPRLAEALLVVPDPDVRALHEDLEAIVDAAEALAGTRPDIAALLADAAAETLASVELPRADADAYLARLVMEPASRDTIETVWEEWSFRGAPIALEPKHRSAVVLARGSLAERLEEIRDRYGPEGELWLSGHAHLDLAWLWPLAETRRKAQRTFRTVLDLLERFPDWTFNQSMAQLYAYLEEDDPGAFTQIRERVAEGRWEVVGGMWVEPDGNLLSGESWARQLLVGQRWLEERLGARATVAWLPDTFGYAANLPQLLRQAGMRWFFTTKLNWSETNRFPHDLYWWEGLDGSRVLAHSFNNRKRNYNGVVCAQDTTDVWRRFRGKRHASASLFTFGWGDGGGGPTAEMLGRAERQRAMPGLPALRHRRVDAYYEMLESETDTSRLPIWVGEKYLEFHRGTYTTQAEIKRLHRRLEHALVEAEASAAIRWRLLDAEYPAEALAGLWRALLRNQFHDILPGSSVRTVNQEAATELAQALDGARNIEAASLEALSAHMVGRAWPSAMSTDGPPRGANGSTQTRDGSKQTHGGSARGAIVVWNLALDDRPLRVEVPEGVGRVRFGERVLDTVSLDTAAPDTISLDTAAPDGRRWVHAPEITVPGIGCVILRVEEDASGVARGERPEGAGVHASPDLLENDQLRVSVLPDGSVEIFDKAFGRPVTGGPANVLWAHPDIPRDFEAWELDADYAAGGTQLEPVGAPEVVSEGPHVGAVRVRRKSEGYDVHQEYRLWASSRRLEIHTTVVSTGRRAILRATIPTTVRSPRATFETAFGAVERPTHANTPWDAAKFEVPGLRWADISEPGYGVSILTDAKYGYAAHGSTLSLSLLRGPVYPDPHADLGEQRFVYAILPHAGDWRSGTVAEAHDLNAPLHATWLEHATAPEQGPGKEHSIRLLGSFGEHLRLSALKRSEDGAHLLARLYEPHGARGTAHLSGELGAAAATMSLLEEDRQPVGGDGVKFGPFEVSTVRLEAKPEAD